MADINPFTPIIDIILFKLYASTWILISVNTLCLRVIKKCDVPIHILMVPYGCSRVCFLSTGRNYKDTHSKKPENYFLGLLTIMGDEMDTPYYGVNAPK